MRQGFVVLLVLVVFASVGFVQSQVAVTESWLASATRRLLRDEKESGDDAVSRIEAAIAAKSAAIAALESENAALRRRQESLRKSKKKRRFVRFSNRAAGCELSVGNDGRVGCEDPSPRKRIESVFELTPAATATGAVRLRSAASGKFVEMVPPSAEPSWVVRATVPETEAETTRTAFELVDGAYVRNVATGGCVTVMKSERGTVRGHGNKPHNKEPGSPEPYAAFDWGSSSSSSDGIIKNTTTSEKRVVSYGLYGTNPKYTQGAIRNSELVHEVFPGWVARFYVRNDVPENVVATLKANGAEIVEVGAFASGKIAGMFWRFLVADDPAVDRFIVRDSDSRLNPREKAAVDEWIASGKKVHSIRDHPNHDRPLNGGLWGGTKRCVPGIKRKISDFSNRATYGGDLQFLNSVVWPLVKHDHLSHDAYTCLKYPNTRPFPTQRPPNYQHVGQVFNAQDEPRMADINGFIRGRQIPKPCRKHPDWKYG
ncbi:hypothetical protein CTAYLR_000622 [Chrysophaeum taylorii]|uniref:Uncharacterized protein n=1 Tax=Chrysophaeum taylorii TaxID=2483200 RepID=A0AAD7XJ67_9STRA|nr:hypothetical protein CTAYLR_000622 [Chrysophaeum taylorii]